MGPSSRITIGIELAKGGSGSARAIREGGSGVFALGRRRPSCDENAEVFGSDPTRGNKTPPVVASDPTFRDKRARFVASDPTRRDEKPRHRWVGPKKSGQISPASWVRPEVVRRKAFLGHLRPNGRARRCSDVMSAEPPLTWRSRSRIAVGTTSRSGSQPGNRGLKYAYAAPKSSRSERSSRPR